MAFFKENKLIFGVLTIMLVTLLVSIYVAITKPTEEQLANPNQTPSVTQLPVIPGKTLAPKKKKTNEPSPENEVIGPIIRPRSSVNEEPAPRPKKSPKPSPSVPSHPHSPPPDRNPSVCSLLEEGKGALAIVGITDLTLHEVLDIMNANCKQFGLDRLNSGR